MTMNKYTSAKSITVLLLIEVCAVVVKCNFDPFMDTTLFTINWQGPLELNKEEEDLLGGRHVMITTNHKEHYRCLLPDTLKGNQDRLSSYKGPSADELMQPLFLQTYCSYRIESYWTYELCHGKHLKQYHETKEPGTQPKIQVYYLGSGNHRDSMKDHEQKLEVADVPVIAVDGTEFPYYEVIMGDGTKCDLTGKPRKAHVLYVCQPHGRGEIYELKESSTCEYEVVVFSAFLCTHPAYRAKTVPVNVVKCHAMLGSPLKPMELSRAENEARQLQDAGQFLSELLTDEVTPEEHRKPKFHRKPKTDEEIAQQKALQDHQSQLGALTDKQTLTAFLTGSQCISGGAGWWRHEICFGKFTKQFHTEKGKETSIFLGRWNEENHIKWLRDNPSKRSRPAEGRKLISLLYSSGDMCDLTGKARQCEVRLKCLQNVGNLHAMILSLSEPETCQYVLTVESALFCSVLKDADDNGLFNNLDI